MLDSFVNRIPENALTHWFWWLSVAAVIVPVVLSGIVALLTVAAIRVNDRLADIKTAAEAENAHQARKREELTKKDLESAKEKLAAALLQVDEAKALALKAEIASRPKPFKDRLYGLLDGIDARFKPALLSGRDVELTGYLKPWQYAELQKLSAESEGKKFISMRVGEGMKATTEGMLTDVRVTIKPVPP